MELHTAGDKNVRAQLSLDERFTSGVLLRRHVAGKSQHLAFGSYSPLSSLTA
jgi:hypothetical protein